jgi:TRAP-type C4-dicarboxylate transport system substrate-binding protein
MVGCAASAPPPAATPTQTAAQVFNWRAVSIFPRSDAERAKFTWLTNQVKERSNGRLNIEWFFSDELIPMDEHATAVRQGTVEASFHNFAFDSGVLPELNVINDMPGTFRTADDAYTFFFSEQWNFVKEIADDYNSVGEKFVCFSGAVGKRRDLYSKKPINSLADLKGMKIMTTGMTAAQLTKAGAETMSMLGSEVYTGWATGAFDGVVWGGAADNKAMGFDGLTKYILRDVGRWWANVEIVANLDAWNKLPNDLQVILEYYGYQQGTAYQYEDALYNTMLEEGFQAKGIVFQDLSAADRATWNAFGPLLWDTYTSKNAKAVAWAETLKRFLKWRGYLQ